MKSLYFALLTILILCLGLAIVVSCGDDDDDDDDDNDDNDDDETDEVVFNEDGLDQGGDGGSGPFGSGSCSESECLSVLTYMDDCKFNCQDENQQPIPCVDLIDYCVACGGNWGCNVTCFNELDEQDSCLDYLQCCVDCSE
jgi:hypothetical protein